MIKFISKSELDSKKSDNKKSHQAGEIYPQIFSNDKGLEFKEGMKLEAGIIWLGSYTLDSNLFPKEKCPVCGKEEVMIPYKAIGSYLSGCHTIQFYCTNCKERFVTNSHIEYFRQIKRYIQENKKNFTPEQKTDKCSPTLDEILNDE